MNWALELHDSTVLAVQLIGKQLILLMTGYLHETAGVPGSDPGAGYVQVLALIFSEGESPGALGDLPADVLGGELRVVGHAPSSNMIALPCETDSVTELELEILYHTEKMVFHGSSLSIVRLGAPHYVEQFTP